MYAWAAEVLGSMAMIIGAFMAGLFFARSPLKKRIEREISPLTYGVFVPIFFVSVGLAADVRQLSSDSLALLMAMCIVVIVSRMLAAGLAGRVGGLTGREALQLGVGMIPRGEVTLIVATVGIIEGLIGLEVFSAAVGMVIVTTLLTPPYCDAPLPAPQSAEFVHSGISGNKEMIMFHLVVLVLDDPDQCRDVLDAWEAAGAPGVTILDSSGLGRVRRATLRDDVPLMPSLSDLLRREEDHHRTLFSLSKTSLR